MINRILSKVRGEEFKLAEGSSLKYTISLLWIRGMMLLRGKFSFVTHGKFFFVGRRVTLRRKDKIIVGNGVTIDSLSYLDANSSQGIIFEDNVSLGKNTVIECSGGLRYLGKGIKVASNVSLGRDCFYGCAGGISIGSNTIIGNFVSFHSENHVFSDSTIPIRLQGVTNHGITIGDNCWLGSKVTILDGVNLGNNCVIAAGAVMKSGTYPSNCVYGGVPAKLIKQRI